MIKIRTYKEGDENGFLILDRLVEIHPWNRRDITNWNWKYKGNNPAGESIIYVAENDTLEVFLFYDHYLAQIETMEAELKIQNYVGLSLIGVLIFVILSIF